LNSPAWVRNNLVAQGVALYLRLNDHEICGMPGIMAQMPPIHFGQSVSGQTDGISKLVARL
jgi:hypothetical protein